MEFLTILLSTLLTLVSPTGLIVDRAGENIIRARFKKVEHLKVRVDNPPAYQILQGKIERLLIAGSGLFPSQDFRIDLLEIETDPIKIDPNSFKKRKPKLKQPFQAGIHLVLKQEDINQALRSPQIKEKLAKISGNFLKYPQLQPGQQLEFINPHLEFLQNNRILIQIEIKEREFPDLLTISAETGLAVIRGHQLQLIQPIILINGQAAPTKLVNAIATGFNTKLDLSRLESRGITARLLQLKITPTRLDMATFIKIEPRFLENHQF